MSTGRLTLPAGVVLLAAGVQYLLLEQIVARAWVDPTYDWAANLVPDLGNDTVGVYQDRVVNSPLSELMNAGFIAQGVGLGVGALLLSRALPGRARPLLATLGVVHAAGLALTGIFSQSATAPLSTLVVNIAGAGLAILAGNTIVVVAGRRWSALGLPEWFGRASVVVSGVTIVAALALFALDVAPPGVRERASIYPFIAWEILVGVLLLSPRTARTRTARLAEVTR